MRDDKTSAASDRSRRARIAAYALHARRDPRETTASARSAATKALNTRLALQFAIDLEAPDAARRLQAARSSHFLKLGLAAAQARRRKAGS